MSTAAVSELDELIRRLGALEAAAPASAAVIGRVKSDLAAAAFHRTRSAADKPIVALVGGTGVGKSSIVNRLIGQDVTATSFRRTFTAGPVAITAGDLPLGFLALPHEDAVEQPPRGQADRVILVRRHEPILAKLTVVDSPDVDGERPDHHAVADRVFRWADAVVFVVTPEKYQMTELQPYYRLAQRYAVPAVFVMNKADSAAVVADYEGLLTRSGVNGAVVRVVPRDDSTWQPPADQLFTADDLELSPAASKAGQKQRVLDATARAGDQVLNPLLDLRSAVDRVVGSVRSVRRNAIGRYRRPPAHPAIATPHARPQRALFDGPAADSGPREERAVDADSTAAWFVGLARGGEFKVSMPESATRGEPPDFSAVVVEQFQALQSRIEDVVNQNPALAEQKPTWKIDPKQAGQIADEELGELKQWLETRWNANPRDTALLMKLLRVIPGGDRVTKYFEAAPYLLAISCLATSHVLGHIDVLVLGGYSAFTWLTEKLSDEVAARTRQTNASIATRVRKTRHAADRRSRRLAGRPGPAAARAGWCRHGHRPRQSVVGARYISPVFGEPADGRHVCRPYKYALRRGPLRFPLQSRHMSRIDWPSLLAGLMMLFYWGRVIKLVFKTKKLTGRAANFLPPELLGRVLRIIWYPNVVAWVVIPMIVALNWHRQTPGLTLLWHNAIAQWAAMIVAGVAYYFTLVCWRKMGRDWRMGIDPNEKNTLIISGPYALVRHPIYALQCSLAVLTFLASPTIALGIVALLQCVLLQWEARREEKHMLSVHGDVYGDYMRQVGRFMPRGRYRAATA
ncbi:MAG: isoprenylcysteine carboxylmethyltransferase family protein [Tepidisphaeraceae bacterium]